MQDNGLQTVLLEPTVWLGVLVSVVVFGLVLRHERRQAQRLTDRTRELEHLSAELIRVNRMKSEFLANVSHELRTPLNAIVGFADLLRDGVYGELSARQMKPVERIEVSATHLRHLVDQILDLAKIAAGRMDIHEDALELKPFILDIASEVEPLLSEKGLSLAILAGPALPRIHTDPAHLRQILVNLIGNAVKFTDRGSVTIRARVANEAELSDLPGTPALIGQKIGAAPWIAVEVVDTGLGVATSDQSRIFEEFEQANPGSRSDSAERGTGLGLAISRRLARLLGGEITLQSELGKGSAFTVWLPAAAGNSFPAKNSFNAR